MQVKPPGETTEVRTIVPVKPLRGPIVIVDVPRVPGLIATSVGFAVIEKSAVDVTL